jgi:hypothetical protein
MTVQIVIGTEQFSGNPANLLFSCKAPEGWRSPRRFAYFNNHHVTHSVLECGGPPPLFHGAISNCTNVNRTCYNSYEGSTFKAAARNLIPTVILLFSAISTGCPSAMCRWWPC